MQGGEREIRQCVIKDENDINWIAVYDGFHGMNIKVLVRSGKKVVMEKVHTKYDQLKIAKIMLKEGLKEEYNIDNIDILGLLVTGSSDNNSTYIFKDNKSPKFDNIDGKNVVYKIRFRLDGKVQDSAIVLLYNCYSNPMARAQFGACGVTNCIVGYKTHKERTIDAIMQTIGQKSFLMFRL